MVASDDTRLELSALEMKQLVITNNNRLAQFQFEPFMVNPGTAPTYADWWTTIFHRAFPLASDHYLSKLIGSSQIKPPQPPRLTTIAPPSAGSKFVPLSKSIQGNHSTLFL